MKAIPIKKIINKKVTLSSLKGSPAVKNPLFTDSRDFIPAYKLTFAKSN
jgi:hypothetical protein